MVGARIPNRRWRFYFGCQLETEFSHLAIVIRLTSNKDEVVAYFISPRNPEGAALGRLFVRVSPVNEQPTPFLFASQMTLNTMPTLGTVPASPGIDTYGSVVSTRAIRPSASS